MPNFYFKAGQTETGTVRPDRLLVALPGTTKLAITPTYTTQAYEELGVVKELGVVMEFGYPELVAAKAAPILYPKLEARAEEALQEAQEERESLESEVMQLNESMTSRVYPLIIYLRSTKIARRAARSIQQSIDSGGRVHGKQVAPFIDHVYNALRVNKDAPSEVRGLIRNYVHNGTYNEETLQWLVQIDPVFEKLERYAQLDTTPQQTDTNSSLTINEVEQYLIETIQAIKSGDPHQEEIEGVNVYQILEQIVGATPGKQFISMVNGVARGKNREGLLVPFAYNGSNVPEELKPYYISTERFTQLIRVFDLSLHAILGAYRDADSKFQDLKQNQGLEVHYGLLIRGLMPKNPAMQALYPDERVQIPDMPELSKDLESKTTKDYHNGEIARLAAPKLVIDEEELSTGLERLVSVQNQITLLLPIEVFKAIALSDKLRSYDTALVEMREEMEQLQHGSPSMRERYNRIVRNDYNPLLTKANALLRRNQKYGKKLEIDFGLDLSKLLEADKQTVEEAINLFGEELGFVRHLNLDL